MSYFPESVMPSRLKDESQDVKGNKHVVSAADGNKHDEEIRAIEAAIGARRPAVPGKGYSGSSSGGAFSAFACGASCFPGAKACGVSTDAMQAMSSLLDRLADIRDGLVLTASGVVAVRDPNVAGADGIISFPSNWPVAALAEAIADAGTTEDGELATLDSVALDDVSDMPSEGFVSVINDVSLFSLPDSEPLTVPGLTSLSSTGDDIYDEGGLSAGASQSLNDNRVLKLGTNVEVLFYSGIDEAGKRILNVHRRQLGTSSTRHAPSDLVFKGVLAIGVAPSLVRIASVGKRIAKVDCVLRSNGRVDMLASTTDDGSAYADDLDLGYAQFHATLVRELDPLPAFLPSDGGSCDD